MRFEFVLDPDGHFAVIRPSAVYQQRALDGGSRKVEHQRRIAAIDQQVDRFDPAVGQGNGTHRQAAAMRIVPVVLRKLHAAFVPPFDIVDAVPRRILTVEKNRRA